MLCQPKHTCGWVRVDVEKLLYPRTIACDIVANLRDGIVRQNVCEWARQRVHLGHVDDDDHLLRSKANRSRPISSKDRFSTVQIDKKKSSLSW